MKYFTLLIPAIVSLTLLWWNGHLFWMFWLVAAIAALTWFCVKAMFNKQNDLSEDFSSNVRAVRDWELVTGLTIWAYWIACFAGIVLAVVLHRHS